MQNKISETVGKNLKAARTARKMTQKEVAALLNKHQPDYSEYETGKIELDYEKIVFLCDLFDITPNDLFEGLFREWHIADEKMAPRRTKLSAAAPYLIIHIICLNILYIYVLHT